MRPPCTPAPCTVLDVMPRMPFRLSAATTYGRRPAQHLPSRLGPGHALEGLRRRAEQRPMHAVRLQRRTSERAVLGAAHGRTMASTRKKMQLGKADRSHARLSSLPYGACRTEAASDWSAAQAGGQGAVAAHICDAGSVFGRPDGDSVLQGPLDAAGRPCTGWISGCWPRAWADRDGQRARARAKPARYLRQRGHTCWPAAQSRKALRANALRAQLQRCGPQSDSRSPGRLTNVQGAPFTPRRGHQGESGGLGLATAKARVSSCTWSCAVGTALQSARQSRWGSEVGLSADLQARSRRLRGCQPAPGSLVHQWALVSAHTHTRSMPQVGRVDTQPCSAPASLRTQQARPPAQTIVWLLLRPGARSWPNSRCTCRP